MSRSMVTPLLKCWRREYCQAWCLVWCLSISCILIFEFSSNAKQYVSNQRCAFITSLALTFPDLKRAQYDTSGEQVQTLVVDKTSYQISSEHSPVIVPSQVVIQCDDCKTEAGVDKFCKTCPNSICEKCAKRHRRDQSNHDIVPRTELIRESELSIIVKPCPTHPECNVKDFCTVCSMPICIKCSEENHKKT